ncbi:DUF3289 family protein [Trabulsiella odontotermitis]
MDDYDFRTLGLNWFLHQRHREYVYKPFLTDFSTHVNIARAM